MENRYFSEAEDRAFTSLVLEYNSIEDCRDERRIRLENIIRERTSVLLYLIPMRNLYLKEEDAGGFFLDIQKDIGWIISSFRISGLTYNGYLTQICRYRVMRYTRRISRARSLDSALVFSDMTMHEPSAKERCIPYSAPSPNEDLSSMDLGAVARLMIRRQGPIAGRFNEKEEVLTRLLQKPIKRRQFISYLLSLPETETPGFIASVSRTMRIDHDTASRFYVLRHEHLRQANEESIAALELVVGRHWKVLSRMRKAIWAETDEEKRMLLRKRYSNLFEVYGRRRRDLMKAHCGMTHKAIAGVLGISRSAVTYDIRIMKDTLTRISQIR